jgi:hypothetical protein
MQLKQTGTRENIELMNLVFRRLPIAAEQSKVCEYVNLHKHKVSRTDFKLHALLQAETWPSFEFIQWLN